MKKKERRERSGDATTPAPFSPRPLYSQPLTFWPFHPEAVLWLGRRGMYRVLSRSYMHGAAIVGNLFEGNKIAANVEIKICMRFYFGGVYKDPLIFLVKS